MDELLRIILNIVRISYHLLYELSKFKPIEEKEYAIVSLLFKIAFLGN